MNKYERSFSLADDPFGPMRADYLGIEDDMKMRKLFVRPLQIHEEPKLMQLYCAQAGPFEHHMRRFKSLMEGYSYSTDPPILGNEPFIFHIRGATGTGKTSLAYRMMHWIKQCKPERNPEWKAPYEPWGASKDFSPVEQEARIKQKGKDIDGDVSDGSRIFIVVDNIKEGALREVLNMYADLEERFIPYMFLLSSHEPLLHKDWRNERFEVQTFDTKELTPDNAVALVKHRIVRYRVRTDLAVFEDYELYPFQEDDIRNAVSRAQETPENGETRETITIRLLNVALHEAIRNEVDKVGDAFTDLSTDI